VLEMPVHRLVERVNPNYFKNATSTASIATLPAPAPRVTLPVAQQAALITAGTGEVR